METTRSRLGSILEWLIAATVMAAVLAVGSLVVREIQSVRAVTPVIAEEAAGAEAPVGIPPRTVSIPILVLVDGKEVRVGDRLSEVLSRLGQAAQMGPDVVERVAVGERITRFYSYIGSRFALVLVRIEAENELRVAGIYLQ